MSNSRQEVQSSRSSETLELDRRLIGGYEWKLCQDSIDEVRKYF